MCENDTIAAPATAAGGAVAVIRISGEEAFALCDRIFRGRRCIADAEGYTALYGYIADAERMLDEVVITVFRAPHSYTGQNSVEISCHGSRYIVAEILALLTREGVRMAEPGEFTTRAFLAGKIDLSQAEAVADMIASSSRAAHALASTQMRGGYSAALGLLRGKLLRLTSLLELELDFSEEDVSFADRGELRDTMLRISEEIDTLRRSFSLGNAIKEGVAVAIIGAPNVGKSTLLNRLLNEERAMVSEIAGTTRDSIEAQTNIDGVLFRFIDTAGIHTTDDRLERMGIERTFATIDRAQIILQVIDAAHSADQPATFLPTVHLESTAVNTIDIRPDQTRIVVVNKIDTAPNCPLPMGAIAISARSGQGIDQLQQALRSCVDTEAVYHGDPIVSNSRHYEALTAASQALRQAIRGIDTGLSSDLLSEEIRQVIHHAGSITGEIATSEILENIFSKFCIGK